MLNTVVRQIAFYQFETLLHDERRSGELLPERIGEIVDAGADRKPRPGLRVHAGVQRVLGLCAALHPLAVLCLCLCVRRLPGECAVCGVPGRASRLPGEVSRHAARRRHQAAQGIAGAVRAGRLRPGVLAEGAGRDLRLHRRAGGGGLDGRCRGPRSTFSANSAAWRAPPARSAASPRAWRARALFGIKTDRAAHAEDLQA